MVLKIIKVKTNFNSETNITAGMYVKIFMTFSIEAPNI